MPRYVIPRTFTERLQISVSWKAIPQDGLSAGTTRSARLDLGLPAINVMPEPRSCVRSACALRREHPPRRQD